MSDPALLERLHTLYTIDQQTGCWIWNRSLSSGGYGQIRHRGTMRRAHRVYYEEMIGPIPAGSGAHGTCVCHRCDVRSCVNPAHLFLGTVSDNNADKAVKGRSNSPKGEQSGQAKLTDEQVSAIRADHRSNVEVARSLGVSHETVRLVRLRRVWGHIGNPSQEPRYAGTDIWRGEKNVNAKLGAPDVSDIRKALSEGRSGVSLARRYGVSEATISDIKHRKQWAHL